jgi:hypothetical protein
MEIELKGVSLKASVYDINKAMELVCGSNGQTPPFEVVSGMGPVSRGRSYKGTDLVNDRTFRPFYAFQRVPSDVGYRPEKAPSIDTYKQQLRKETENSAKPLRLPIAKVQLGVWYTQPDKGRAFFVEYEREYLTQSSVAYVDFAHKDNVICIDVSGTLSTVRTRMNSSLLPLDKTGGERGN